MPAIGASSRAHIRKVYTIAAAMAGAAGAVIAQTTQTVSLEALSFERSADVLVMLVLGGAGRLYGGLVGAAIFMVARDQFSGSHHNTGTSGSVCCCDGRHVASKRHPRRLVALYARWGRK